MLKDLRFAVRMLAKDRWYAAVAIVTLMLGIGLNAAVFTLVNAVLIRGLPFKDSGRLYMLSSRRTNGSTTGAVSHPDLQDWRAQSRTFAGFAAFSNNSFNLSDDRGLPEQVRGSSLTEDAFRLLGQPPLIGRDFAGFDYKEDAPRAVILGYTVWKNRYNADRDVLGRSVRIDGQPATIVGVMPDGMKFPSNSDIWVAFRPNADQSRRSTRFLSVFGRLRDGAGRAGAQAELNGIASRLAAAYPDTNKEIPGVLIETFNDRFNGGPIRVVFLALMGSVGFVLLIACANVANLLLARSTNRTREVAVRIALGATRWRVVRQLLIESILLGFIGGMLGLLLATVGVRLFDAAVADTGKPYWIVFTMDYMVFAFFGAICVMTGIVFGLAPAIQVSKTNVNEVLKEGGRGTAGTRRARWLTGTMVVVELALTIVLLVGAGLMIRSFLKVYNLDLGIRPDHLMAMRLQLPDPKYKTAEAKMAFYERLMPRLAAIAGVDSVAVTTSVPPSGGGSRTIEFEGRPSPKTGDQPLQATVVTISPSFFQATGVQIRRGRVFNETDGTSGSETAIVNERLAAQFFPNEDPLGKRFRFPPRDAAQGQPPPVWRTIVGISPTIRHNSPQDAEPSVVVYVPYRQDPPGFGVVIVRSQLEPAAIMQSVRVEVQKIDQDQPVFTVQTIEQMLAQSTWPYRVFGSLFALFALIALVLSSVGLYAVMAYSVTQRTTEIGVRVALGAGAKEVSWLILRQGLVQLAIGVGLGLLGAFGLSRVLRTVLIQVSPTDPVTFASITGLLTAVAIAACLVPAWRAARLDPLVALRKE